jgi:hypothetical protein
MRRASYGFLESSEALRPDESLMAYLRLAPMKM